MRTFFSTVLVVVVFSSAAGCKKKVENPAGPSSTESAWTGTLTRPSGLGTMTVSWPTVTGSDGRFAGPMTLTYNGQNLVLPSVSGGTAGNSSIGYTVRIEWNATTGQIAAFPTCSMNAAPVNNGEPFPSPYKTIANMAMTIFYNGCAGFITVGNNEVATFNLTKP